MLVYLEVCLGITYLCTRFQNDNGKDNGKIIKNKIQ